MPKELLLAPDFQSIFEALPGLYLILDPGPDFRILAVSDSYLRATMTRREEIAGRPLFQVFPDNPADPAADGVNNLRGSLIRVAASRASDTMPVQRYDIRKPVDDGGGFEVRYWSPTNCPVLGPDGAIKYIIHNVDDVTEFVRLQEREHEQHQLTEELRKRAERLLIDEGLRTVQAKDLSAREAFEQLETLLIERRRSGEQLRRQAEELAQSNEALEQFAYIASHDLSEPLRGVVLFSQLLGRRFKPELPAEGQEYIDYVVAAASRMQDMVKDLLDFSRVATAQSLRTASADCATILQAALRNCEFAIRESGAQVTHDPLPNVPINGSELVQVFQNLITNAIKYCGGRPPHIHISAMPAIQDDIRVWRVSVNDRGIGIAPEYHEKIFHMFRRLHGSHIPGTGMGLAICKRIVERHGGHIWVESKLGEGCTFHFTLPAEPVPFKVR